MTWSATPADRLPTGQVTFVLTDIEGSTALLTRLGDAYAPLLEEHHQILSAAIGEAGGCLFHTAGDSLFFAFADPGRAVRGAVDGQLRLIDRNLTSEVRLAVRMGVHTGPATVGPTGYVGLGLHHTARVAAVAKGLQILVSETTAALIRHRPIPDVTLEDLGAVSLKDVPGTPHLFGVQHPLLPHDFPPLLPPEDAKGNLPATLGSFVGRERELTDLEELLGRARLVTVVATSGTGKTRLALELGRRMQPSFPGGVWLVDLSPLDPTATTVEIVGAVASAVGIRDTGDVARAVEQCFEARRGLLLFDNCDRLVEPVSAVVSRLAGAARHLAILATSQLPLRVPGETVYRLRPLELPGPGDDPLSASAVQLFVERARAVRDDFRLDSRSVEAVVRICRRLDGVAFGIELAAARMSSFTAIQVAERLEDVFGIRLPSPAPERHSTLQAAVRWSYQLLDADEQTLLNRLSVFSGGATLETIEAVCNLDNLPPARIMAIVSSLVEKSLVVFDDSGDPPAYRLLQMVHTFAADRLGAAEETPRLLDRHLETFLAMAEEAAPHLAGPEQARVEDLLDANLENLRAAFRFALTKPDSEFSLRLANAVWRFLEDRGYWGDWRRMFDQALAHPGPAPVPIRAWGLAYGSVAAERLGPLDLSEERARTAIQQFKPAGDRAGASFALGILGSVAMDRGDSEQAVACIEEALSMRIEIGDRRGVGVSLANLGKAHYERGDYSTARSLMVESLGILEDLNDQARYTLQLGDVALVSLVNGDLDEAFEYARKGVELARQTGHRYNTAWTTALLGRVVAAQGQAETGAALLADAIEVLAELGDDRSLLSVVGDLAVIKSERKPLEAAEVLVAARSIRERLDLPADTEERVRYAATERAIEASVPVDALKSAHDRGSRLGLEQLVRLSLNLVRPA
jgi:predicted ATPase/class 3 adenylate cyclase